MNKFMQHSALLSLLLCSSWVTAGVPSHLTPINPITVTLENGPITLDAGATGTASYLVSVDAGVMPYSPLTMSISTSQPWASVSQATSTCTTPNTCTSPISLLPGHQCCLMLTLDGTQLTADGHYALAPSVATNPAAFGGNAASQPVTVTAAPTNFTVTVSSADDATGTAAPATQTVASGGNTTELTALPVDSTYIVDYWLYTGTDTYSYQGGGLTSTYYDVTEDAAIEVFFVPYTASITVPAAPTDFTALNTTSSTEVVLTWGAPDNGGTAITHYKVTPYTGATAGTPVIFNNVTTGTISLLTPSTAYTFTIQAINTSSGGYTAAYGPAAYSSAVTPAASVVASPAALALSVNDPSNINLTGNPRTITFYNDSGASVTLGAPAVAASGLPTGTTITATTCASSTPLANGGSCTVTVTPGSDATSGCTDGTTTPTAGTVTLNTTVGGPYTADVYVLGYGCQYQGGYIYSIDDTTPTTSSIGGTVAATSDQVAPSPGIIWSSNGTSGVVNYTSIWGIDEQSLTDLPYPNNAAPSYYGISDLAALIAGQLNCNGSTDGSCNTNNIYTYYQQTFAPPLADYAAGLCKTTISGYSDWYLPSICEMGYFDSTLGVNPNSGCGASVNPTSQNMQSNLVDNGNIGAIAGIYWSSTEFSGFPQDVAWVQVFAPSGSFQGGGDKSVTLGVRCSRALTL